MAEPKHVKAVLQAELERMRFERIRCLGKLLELAALERDAQDNAEMVGRSRGGVRARVLRGGFVAGWKAELADLVRAASESADLAAPLRLGRSPSLLPSGKHAAANEPQDS